MGLRLKSGLVLALLAYLIFLAGAKNVSPASMRPSNVPGSVVLPSPLQAVLYLGDPYMAANVEATRVLMTGGPVEGVAQDYFDRLHQTVAVLNPCHEDNYYIANGLMAWAGSVDGAIAIMRGATTCRFWDEVPPFFLGFDLYFFKRQHHLAKAALFEAAARASDNRIGFQRMGLLFESEAYPDVKMAYKFLVAQRDQAHDGKLRQLLGQRIGRLEGLIVLRDAQTEFEHRFARALQDPQELLAHKILKQFPADPTRLGYVFEGGEFALREVKIRGMEGMRK